MQLLKPLIGVTPDFNAGDREDMGGREPTYFLRARYLRAIEHAGGIPLVLPLIVKPRELRQILSTLDGLLITGSGADLAPELYGEQQQFPFRRMSKERANLELQISHLAYKARLPTLGICGGMQSINVALGGTLYQDIPSQLSTRVPHQPAHPATKPAHLIAIAPRSLLWRITRKQRCRVNSSHHQSVKTVAVSLRQTAVAPDGVIEAIEAPTHPFYLGVQWHPEFLFDRYADHLNLFKAFIRAAKRFRRSALSAKR